MTDFTVKVVTAFRVATFLNKLTVKCKFLGIYETFNKFNIPNLDCQM